MKVRGTSVAEAFRLGRKQVPDVAPGLVWDVDGDEKAADHCAAIALGLGQQLPVKADRSLWFWPDGVPRPLVKSPCQCWLMDTKQRLDVVLVHLNDRHSGFDRGYERFDNARIEAWLKVAV